MDISVKVVVVDSTPTSAVACRADGAFSKLNGGGVVYDKERVHQTVLCPVCKSHRNTWNGDFSKMMQCKEALLATPLGATQKDTATSFVLPASRVPVLLKVEELLPFIKTNPAGSFCYIVLEPRPFPDTLYYYGHSPANPKQFKDFAIPAQSSSSRLMTLTAIWDGWVKNSAALGYNRFEPTRGDDSNYNDLLPRHHDNPWGEGPAHIPAAPQIDLWIKPGLLFHASVSGTGDLNGRAFSAVSDSQHRVRGCSGNLDVTSRKRVSRLAHRIRSDSCGWPSEEKHSGESGTIC